MSAKNEDWDVKRREVEFDEYWKLRRKFLRTHKDKFPEDLLNCLAQIFIDVELLGCSYPQRTMDLVKELSQDIPAKYIYTIENPKKKSQKTFVEASEAASSKIKECTDEISTVAEESTSNTLDHISNATYFIDQSPSKKRSKKDKKLDAEENTLPNATKKSVSNTIDYNSQSNEVSIFRRYFEELYFEEIQSEKLKTEPHFEEMPPKRLKSKSHFEEMPSERLKTESCCKEIQSERIKTEPHFEEMPPERLKSKPHFEEMPSETLKTESCCKEIQSERIKTEPHFEEIQSERLKTERDVSFEYQDKSYGDIIIWERPGDDEFTTLKISVRLSGKTLKWRYSKNENSCECFMYIDSEKLCSNTNVTKKTARKSAVNTALKKLRKCYYTVKVKNGSGIDPVVIAVEIKQDSLPDRTGSICTETKFIVDWPGDNFEKSDQVTVELTSPIVETQVNQEVLGWKINNSKTYKITTLCQRVFKHLLQKDILQNDIVFLDFSTQDRALIQKIAHNMGLNPRKLSMEKGKIVVSRKVNVQNFIKQLNKLGGVTEKYELVKPTDKKFVLRQYFEEIQSKKLNAEPYFEKIQSEKLNAELYFEEIQSEKLNADPYFEEILSEKLNADPYFEEIQSEKLNADPYFEEIQSEKLNAESYFEEIQSEKLKTKPYFNEIQSERLKTEKEVSLKDQYNQYIDIVLLERPGDDIFTTLEVSASVSGKTLKWNYCKKEKLWEVSVNIESRKLSCITKSTKIEARNLAANIALEKLRKWCYTVKVNKKLKTKPYFEETPPKRLKIEANVSLKDQDNPFRDIVLWERPGDDPITMLKMSIKLSGKVLECKYSKEKNFWKCCMNINSQELSCSNLSLTKIGTAESAADIALEKLRKCCYTVKVTEGSGIDPVVTAMKIKKESLPDWTGSICTEKILMVNWPDDSFGKSDQGTVELMSPIVDTQINQEVYDLKIKKKIEIIVICERLLQTDNVLQTDIIFLGFLKKDRKLIRQIAGRMDLNCRKIKGKEKRKRLIVSRKVDIWRLVKQLNELGGVTAKYELVKPTNENYPQRTMDLVKELSQDDAAEYREEQKKKLQRKFVEPSEAASSEIKGCADKTSTVAEELNTLDHTSNATNFIDQSPKKCSRINKKLDAEKKSLSNNTKEPVSNAINHNFQSYEVSTFRRCFEELYFEEIQSEKLKTEPYFEEMPSKKIKTEPYFEEMLSERLKTEPYFEEIQSEKLKTESYFGEMPAKKIKTESYFEDVSSESLESLDSLEPCVGDIQSEILESDEDVSLEDQNNPYIDIVLWERPGDCEFEMLNYSVKLSGKALQWNFFKKKRLWECFMNINSHGLCRSTDSNKKAARNVAVTAALKKLRKCCYTVKVKVGVGIDPVVTAMDIMQESLPDDDWNGSDCIEKLMVGWVGDSLGNLGQDTMKAIVETQENQEGFGLKIKKAHEIIVNCEKLLETDNILQNDIVFADFPREDRMLIDKIAGKMDLNTRYYIGKLVVSRKVDVWRLVKQLNKLGGVTEKYELVKPTDKKFISLPASTDI
ncbi:PREDICTED: uncharacterized protein LOC105452820 isoform X1 [Wasmannia auropunctata]|uniref:uncharacterized protein LOC105452820 isoform X1 n=1 Tax=Wasmannia auropunctata TaxID=64793 RepID=UPI0005EF60B0|nr:PREDICTED: uncharacterized protein LOC105452820 isoform X1 [Wasmannia auropunctata]